MKMTTTPLESARGRVPKTPASILALAFTLVLALNLSTAGSAQQTVIAVPDPDIGVDTMAARQQAQLGTREAFGVPVDFSFVDRVEESGITFVHRIVDDAGRTYKAAHYDHGNGLAVADVDGDGHLDLYFTNQMGANELWRARGDGTFEDDTDRSGVGIADRVSVTASFGDIDNDGDADLFVTTVRMGNLLFENDGTGVFSDISGVAGVAYVGHSSGAAFLDYDGDGLLDLYVTNIGNYTIDERGRGGYWIAREDAFSGHLFPERTETSILYRNLGGNRFRDVSRALGVADGSWSGDLSVVDFNEDSWPDLYLTNMQGDDRYYENSDGRAFVQKTSTYFPKTPWGAMGVKAFDYDVDGDLDLILTDMHSDMAKAIGPELEPLKSEVENAEQFFDDSSNNILGNAFYRNDGGGTFTEISDEVGTENYWPWGVSVGDLNADGYEDVFITSCMNYPFRYGINSLLLNDRGGVFRPAEFLLGVEPRRDGRTKTPWFELDCDDVDASHLECTGRSGRVLITANLGTRTSVFLDLEGDGDLDIVTGEFNSAPQVLVSDLSESRSVNWLQVRLEGTFSNRDAIGAWVRVRAGERTQTRFVDGKSGYLSQSRMALYFGLGDTDSVDSIEVIWPSGGSQTLDGPIAANRVVDIVEE